MITKEKIILLGILAIIGTGMVLAAYFIENISNNEKSGQAEDNDIAIILKPNQEVQEKGCEETDACSVEYEGVPEKTDELESSELKVYAADRSGVNATKEETAEISELTGSADGGSKQGIDHSTVDENEYAPELTHVPSPPMPNEPPSLESLQRNITSSLNVIVVQNNQVVSNETVDLDEG